jgi:hypothetical protein
MEDRAMAVTLENRLRQMQVFNLAHDAYCRGRECACSEVTVVVTDENPRTGERAPKRVPKKVPAALTLLAREVRDGLPDAVLRAPEVRAAIDRGALRVVRQAPDAPLPSAPATAEVPERTRLRARKEE